jgi:ABC-type multidrug transport system fused ATPase/permease subunit
LQIVQSFYLDESILSFDTKTESDIQQAIHQLAGSRTIIVIAHRLSTVRAADEIIVLDQGKIVERGSHDGLIAENGTYLQLCMPQYIGG